MVATTNAIAKVAAAVAGLSLVAMSLAFSAVPAKAAVDAATQAKIDALMAQIASLQGGSSSSASMTFTMDLHTGSSGADVTALQNWLISKGYSIPAGATGYFGAQTASALAAFQAANGISPASGYFGPVTRAKVNSMAGGSTTTGGTSTGGLSGGEADLRNFDLLAGDDLMEADSDAEIAVAKFDVDGGDARLQRVTIDFQAVSGSYSEKPWDYVNSLAVYLDGKKIGDVDAGSKSDWDKEDDDSAHTASSLDFYTIDVSVNGVVKEGDKAELSIRADAQDNYDGTDVNQTFKVQVPTDGIRAVDSQGIQQYTGDGEEIVLGFDAEESGDLTVKKSSDTPTAGTIVVDDTTTSDQFDVLKFEIKNTDAADALINSITFTVATSTADSVASDLTDIVRTATLTVNGDDFDGDVNNDGTIDFNDLDVTVDGDDTTDFTLSVELFGQSGHYQASGQGLTFKILDASTDVDAEGVDSGDNSTVSGSAIGYTQSIAVDGGITVEGNSMSAVQTYNSNTVTASYGTFTLKFDVTANGDDVYIPKTIGVSTNTSNQTASSTHKIGVEVETAMSASTTSSVTTTSLTTTADSENSLYYIVHDGDSETFTATVTVNPLGTSSDVANFQVGLDKVYFSATSANLNSLQSVDVDQTDSDFRTDPITIAG